VPQHLELVAPAGPDLSPGLSSCTAPSIRRDCSRRGWHGRCHRRPEARHFIMPHSACDAARRSTVASPRRVLPVGAVDDHPPAHHAAELTERSCIRDGPFAGAIVLSRENDMKRWFAGVLAVAGTWLACMAIVGAQTGAPPPAA